jgi:alcohol dehydrogenase class IV
VQKEFFGFDSIQNLKKILKEYNAKNIFLITGKKSYEISGAEGKIKPFLENIKHTYFNNFNINPTLEDVEKGIIEFKKVDPNFIIAVGGGSVIDIAKAINVLSVNEGKPNSYLKGLEEIKNSGKPLIAIPLTAGTGTESTRFSTIYFNKKKYSLVHDDYTLPTISIIDPLLTMSMTPYLTASTGLDALCQGIESYWSTNSTEKSRDYAKQAVKLAWRNIEKAVNKPGKENRLNMAKAANLSGKAINISKTTACHSISYPITSYFNIPHGHAVTLTMPEMLDFNYNLTENDCNDKRGSSFVKQRIREIFNIIRAVDGYDAKDKLNNLMMKINIERKLSKLNINKKGLELIIKKGFTPDRMNNNPRNITEKQLREILERIL